MGSRKWIGRRKREVGSRKWEVGLHFESLPYFHFPFPISHFLLLFFLAVSAAAQTRPAKPWWFRLEEGKFSFSGGSYGDALNAFEDARRGRREAFSRMEANLIILLSNPEVRRLGDSLDRVEAYIKNRSQTDAAAALEELYYRVPRKRLNGSAAEALSALGKLKDYPEAEYWIGEVYRAEGEPALALIQYQKAYALRDLLEVPGFELTLLYKTAELCRLQRDYPGMERVILDILDEPGDAGSLWGGETGAFARRSMAEILGREDGISRFLTLYRYNRPEMEKAHRMLGFFYYDSGRHSPGPALEQIMFAFLIQNTVIIDEIIRRQYGYSFSTLDDLVERAQAQPLLRDYMEETEYFKTIYYLGSSLFGESKTASARQFWLFLARRPEAGQWRDRARLQLAGPHIERPLIGNSR